ncbi:site-specific integrase [Actinoplanes couchii]|uniref:Site-specific integrase n=1 Tax=Actinoplanes couchii TaxID=403638 RepID=A0ABQ3XSU2_9ACTN|nr:site-specific integrase [Actinoplanes couchii]MDR6324054.1 integrase [Actinoplanes couchii]GID61581.1 site-specific integrase [Actinoplanes couchii]
MAEGSVFKHCGCKDDDGKRLANRCPKLRRPGGAWHPSHGRWAYQLELPKTAEGRRRPMRRYRFETRDAAATERDNVLALLALSRANTDLAIEIGDLLQQLKPTDPLPDRDMIARRVKAGIPATTAVLLGDYLREWLTGRRIAAGTQLAYDSHIRNHLDPHLGHIPIEKLRGGHIQAMFTAIADRNIAIETARDSEDPTVRASVKSARTTGPASMQRIRATLRKALNDAIRVHRLIEFNPAAHVELASGKRPKARVWTAAAVKHWKTTAQRPSPVMVWTPEQAGTFLDYTEDHDIVLYPLYALMLHRGLRRGEAIGLRDLDLDLDLDTGTAVISQQITTVGYQPVTKKVKSEAGDRTVALDQTTTAITRSHLARRARWRLVSGPAWPQTGLVYVQPDGTPWHPDTITKRFDDLVEKSGLPPIRLHDLRHCAATFLKASGSDLQDIKEMLGHSTITITSDTYTSVIQELETERAKAEAAAALVPRITRRAS